MLRTILELVIAYLVIRFIVNLFQSSPRSSSGGSSNPQKPQIRVEQRPNASEQRPTSSSKEDDYIDYEEVK